MPYTVENFKSKKALRDAVSQRAVPVYQPGPFGPGINDGPCCIEGPHYPEPHRWYAEVQIVDATIPQGSKVR
jgi:hypothetical protein